MEKNSGLEQRSCSLSTWVTVSHLHGFRGKGSTFRLCCIHVPADDFFRSVFKFLLYFKKKWARLSLNLYYLWHIKRDRKTNTCINKLKSSEYFSYSVDRLNFTHNCICILRGGTSSDGQVEKEARSFCYQCSSEPFSSLQNVI